MNEKETVITIRKESLWKYSTFILAALLIIVLFVWLGDNDGKDRGTTGRAVRDVPPPQLPPPSGAAATIDDDPVLGDKDSPVTLIEFSDYQCPFCRKFWTETFPSIKKEYIDTGKVKFVYRDFPLGFHPAAEPAAEAANCVREKGGDTAYFKMHDKIFQEGNKLDGGDPNTGPVQSTVQFGNAELKQWAKDLGYDIGSCLDGGKYKSEVQKDLADGSASGVQGTPGFFINGQQISGAQPFSVFKQAIDAAL